jgi:Reverse transcriptase (RNA-dependent DNA polymerase)
VPRQSGYHGRPIRAERGVTQGDIISPIIFNIVVDAVVRHWQTTTYADSVHSIFYADDGWLASTSAERLQSSIACLTDLFRRVGPNMNAVKTKAFISNNGVAVTRLSTPAFSRKQRGGSGDTYSARKRRRVTCEQCGTTMQDRSLAKHLLRVHGQYHRIAKRRKVLDEARRDPILYCVSVPGNTTVACPVELCEGRARTRDQLCSHFVYRHPRDIIHIDEDGPEPLPRCARCDMFVPTEFLLRHYSTRRCQEGTERKRKLVWNWKI